MRRLFIIRKDLNLKSGKLAAMIGHCCEAYWTNMLKASKQIIDDEYMILPAINPLNPSCPAIYKSTELIEMSQKAFDEGKSSFTCLQSNPQKTMTITIKIDKDIWNEYVNNIFTKTVCECKNLNKLKEAAAKAVELGLVEGVDFGYINDKCLTDLTPENDDGTCTIGIWFKPLDDEIAHSISKKYKLYRD